VIEDETFAGGVTLGRAEDPDAEGDGDCVDRAEGGGADEEGTDEEGADIGFDEVGVTTFESESVMKIGEGAD